MNMELSTFEIEVGQLLIDTLDLEIEVQEILPNAALFYEGLSLDSIDALEISLEISKRYKFDLRSDDENNANIFANIRALAAHIEENKQA